MSNWDLGVVTDAGVTLLNKIQGGTATADIDSIVIGSGVYSSSEKATIARRTALKNQQLSATINKKLFPDANTLEVKTSIDNTTVSTGFNITECGVYATMTEGGVTSTILFAVAYTDNPDYMSAYNGEYPQIVLADFYFPIANDGTITVTLTQSAYALAEDLDALEDEVEDLGDELDILSPKVDKAYLTDDTAETTLANSDYLPFYDASASAKKRMLLSTARNDVRKRIAESVNNDVMETIGGTAQKSYSIGQYFLGNDGYYYVATAAITAGSSTISTGVGGKCSKTSIAAGMNNLLSQISNLATKVNDKCILVANTSIRLPVVTNGTKTVRTILTETLNAIKALNPSDYGATHMRIKSLTIPIGDANGTTWIIYPVDYEATLVESYSNVSGIYFSKTSVTLDQHIGIYGVFLSSSASDSQCGNIFIPGNSVYNDRADNKPASGVYVYIRAEFYKQT